MTGATVQGGAAVQGCAAEQGGAAATRVAVFDYGVGNLHSIVTALRHVGADVQVSADEAVLRAATHVVLPGVGAFGDAARALRATGKVSLLNECVAAGKPLMGICLGMQLLFERSYEYGEHEGLGYLPGSVVSLADALAQRGSALKVPHMGWNVLEASQPGDPLLAGVPAGASVYFVHSYFAQTVPEALVATAEYGVDVPAIVRAGTVCGCQFHPEKSGSVGLGILRAWLAEGGAA